MTWTDLTPAERDEYQAATGVNPDENPVEHRYTAMGRWNLHEVGRCFWLTFPLACGHHVEVHEDTPLDDGGVHCDHPDCGRRRPLAAPVDWERVWDQARPDTCRYVFPDGRGCAFGHGHMYRYHQPEPETTP